MAVINFAFQNAFGSYDFPLGTVTVQGIGDIPTGGLTGGPTAKIPDGTYTLTANIPAGFELTPISRAGTPMNAWMSNPNFGTPFYGASSDWATSPLGFETPTAQTTRVHFGPNTYPGQPTGEISATIYIYLRPAQSKTVSVNATVTGGFPLPTATLIPLVDGAAGDIYQVPAVTLNTPFTHSWQIPTGHTVKVRLHLENAVGAVDIDSNQVST